MHQAPPTLIGTFDPGNIVSDAVFYNTGAMTEAQIRQFVLAQGEGCTAALCLKNLRVSTPGQSADRYCAAYRGGANEDVAAGAAAGVGGLWHQPAGPAGHPAERVGAADQDRCVVLDVQRGVGVALPGHRTWRQRQLRPGVRGVLHFNQAYGMAKQWSRYKLDPEKYNYHAGQTVNILWITSPSPGVGHQPVTI